ncbi:MAG: SCO family protein [Acidobacteria bacterium]|nr:SCO family protein [Acidobacteriota bacterium]
MNRRTFLTKAAKPFSLDALWRRHYTNVVLTTHEGKQVRFYDDLIKGKIAAINFIYVNCEGICPLTTTNLIQVQEALKDRVGRDIFLYSITLKPEQDDPTALKHFAQMHGVKLPGWLFLTGDPDEIETLRFRLFSVDSPNIDENIEQHTGMIHLVNEPIKRTCKVPALATPRQIIQSISWMEPTTVRMMKRSKPTQAL